MNEEERKQAMPNVLSIEDLVEEGEESEGVLVDLGYGLMAIREVEPRATGPDKGRTMDPYVEERKAEKLVEDIEDLSPPPSDHVHPHGYGLSVSDLAADHLRIKESLIEDQPDVRDEHEVKQAIIIRRDLGMRRGKEIAQGSHASIAFLTNVVAEMADDEATGELAYPMYERLSEAAWKWIDGSFTKVTLQVKDEAEMLAVYEKAKEEGVEAHIIKDSGRTEFGGVPTYTALAIGPDWVENVDKVTRELRLY